MSNALLKSMHIHCVKSSCLHVGNDLGSPTALSTNLYFSNNACAWRFLLCLNVRALKPLLQSMAVVSSPQ